MLITGVQGPEALAKDLQVPPEEREKNLLGAILDLTKALTLSPTETRFYQIRGIAYRDYGIFKLQANSKLYDRHMGVKALKASIADLKKVLDESPSRDDIALQISKSQDLLDSAAPHH